MTRETTEEQRPLFEPGDKVTYWTRRAGEPSRKVVAEIVRVSVDGTVARVIRTDTMVPVRQVETKRLRKLETT